MRLFAALVFVWLTAPPMAAVAAPRADADKLYAEGVRLLTKGDVKAAVEHFQLAAELERSAPLLFNLGQGLAKLGRLEEAKKTLEEALELAKTKGPESMVKLASDALVALEARYPRIVLELPKDAKSARVEVDGKPAELGPDGIRVEPGKHTLAIAAEGFEPYQEELRLQAGEKRTVRPDLERKEAVKTKAVEEEPSPASAEKKPSLLGPAILGGVGLVALGGATYFYLQVRSIDDERRSLWSSSGCPGPSCPSGEPKRALELREDAEQKALLGNVLLGIGATAVVASGVWYFLSQKPRREKQAITLMPTPRGVVVAGSL